MKEGFTWNVVVYLMLRSVGTGIRDRCWGHGELWVLRFSFSSPALGSLPAGRMHKGEDWHPLSARWGPQAPHMQSPRPWSLGMLWLAWKAGVGW